MKSDREIFDAIRGVMNAMRAEDVESKELFSRHRGMRDALMWVIGDIRQDGYVGAILGRMQEDGKTRRQNDEAPTKEQPTDD